MTKLIAALIIAAALFCGYRLFLYWDQVNHEEETAKKEAAAKVVTSGDQLQGMPYQLNTIYQAADKNGSVGLKNFLKTYGSSIADPRKAWIELDYCREISRENPAEARRIYADVKARTQPSSPIYPRIKQLEKTYE